MSEYWTARLTTQLRREVVRVDHNAEHHAIAAFLKRKTRPNTEARFPLATLIRIVRGWGNCPVRYSTLIDVLDARGFSVHGVEPQYVYGLEVLPPGEENERNLAARDFTAEEWHTFCDALRALTVDDSSADTLPLGILGKAIRSWAVTNGHDFRPTQGVLRALVTQAGYEVFNVHKRGPSSGQKQCRRYVHGLQLR
ncbi:hypothetical protein [Streptomyces olivaceus]|uniref:hypothetical protein n=1 Tax=Streptomyces olivaceus TaxID=47716 RepID=UPI003719E279